MFHESGVQLGKQGVTNNFVQTLEGHFQNHRIVKVSVLKNARKDKNDVKMHAEEIIKRLGDHYDYRMIGFTIILRKWKNSVR
ncbi:MAG: YhbY family RNA-binding protein [Nanoarchaeota archaeon]